MTTEQVPSKELAYRDALARIRQVCRSDAKDFEAATIERRQVYDIANMTLDAHGDLYASGHEPPADPNPLDPTNHYFRKCLKGHVAYSVSFPECPSCKIERERAAPPPEAWRSALVDKPTEADGPVVLVFTGEAYSVEYPADVNGVEHIAWRRITPYTRPTKEVKP